MYVCVHACAYMCVWEMCICTVFITWKAFWPTCRHNYAIEMPVCLISLNAYKMTHFSVCPLVHRRCRKKKPNTNQCCLPRATCQAAKKAGNKPTKKSYWPTREVPLWHTGTVVDVVWPPIGVCPLLPVWWQHPCPGGQEQTQKQLRTTSNHSSLKKNFFKWQWKSSKE